LLSNEFDHPPIRKEREVITWDGGYDFFEKTQGEVDAGETIKRRKAMGKEAAHGVSHP
jgi:hypothetical protein